MFQKYLTILMLISITLLFTGCPENVQYSEIPEIKYVNHQTELGTDILGNSVKKVILTFSVIDGDGDIGLSESDTIAPYDSTYYHNLFMKLYEKYNDNWHQVEMGDNANYRVPIIDVENMKAYKADIDVHMSYSTYDLERDTIKYELFLVDRALNHSNTITTPQIIFK